MTEKTEETPKNRRRDPWTELDNLKRCLAKMAHFTGQQRVLDEFDIPRWEIQQKDMKKYKD